MRAAAIEKTVSRPLKGLRFTRWLRFNSYSQLNSRTKDKEGQTYETRRQKDARVKRLCAARPSRLTVDASLLGGPQSRIALRPPAIATTDSTCGDGFSPAMSPSEAE